MEQKIKISKIIASSDLVSLSIDYLPDISNQDFFFISYSHLDYKDVYVDLLGLQVNEINVWYDRGMAAGSDWKVIAEQHMTPFECKGIIFYVSENSIVSPSFIREVEFARSLNKPIITINLPFKSDYVYDRENVKGKIYPVKKMLSILDANNVKIPSFLVTSIRIEHYFPEDVIYLPIAMPCERKAEQLKLKLNEIPALEFAVDEDIATLTRLNNHNVTQVLNKDLPSEKIIKISKTLFANCQYLEYMNFNNKQISYIGESAFANCKKLVVIDEVDSSLVPEIKDSAFQNCESLMGFNQGDSPNICKLDGDYIFENCSILGANSEINIIDTERIGKATFKNCGLLNKIVFLDDKLKIIDENAFESCLSLKDIVLPESLLEIRKSAFSLCPKIEEIVIPNTVTSIGDIAFSFCESLKRVKLSKNIKRIGVWAFEGCNALEVNESEGLIYLPAEDNPYFALIGVKDNDLETANINKQCQIIAGGVFYKCLNIKKVFIPSSVTYIGSSIFSKENKNVVEVYYDGYAHIYYQKLEINEYNKILFEDCELYFRPYGVPELFLEDKKNRILMIVTPILSVSAIITTVILNIVKGWLIPVSIIEIVIVIILVYITLHFYSHVLRAKIRKTKWVKYDSKTKKFKIVKHK